MRLKALLLAALLLMMAGCTPMAPAAPVEPVEILPSAAPATPTAAPTPAETVQPTAPPTPTPPPPLYKVRVSELNVRSTPSSEGTDNIVGKLAYEDTLYYLGEEEEFSRVRLMDGTEAYCFAEYIVPEDTVLYAYIPPETTQKVDIKTGNLVFEKDGVTPVMVKNELIDLKLRLPDAEYEQLFNTENNVVGEPLYGKRTVFLAQKGMADKLMQAYDMFKADGYTLKFYDAYRPLSAQKRLFDVVQNSSWIADPSTTASNHNRGAAVDIALIDDATGEELAFPTPMHTFSKEAARTCTTWTEEQAANVDYMTNIMVECGFSTIKSEWWHFSDTDSALYMTTDLNLDTVTMLPYDQLPENAR